MSALSSLMNLSPDLDSAVGASKHISKSNEQDNAPSFKETLERKRSEPVEDKQRSEKNDELQKDKKVEPADRGHENKKTSDVNASEHAKENQRADRSTEKNDQASNDAGEHHANSEKNSGDQRAGDSQTETETDSADVESSELTSTAQAEASSDALDEEVILSTAMLPEVLDTDPNAEPSPTVTTETFSANTVVTEQTETAAPINPLSGGVNQVDGVNPLAQNGVQEKAAPLDASTVVKSFGLQQTAEVGKPLKTTASGLSGTVLTATPLDGGASLTDDSALGQQTLMKTAVTDKLVTTSEISARTNIPQGDTEKLPLGSHSESGKQESVNAKLGLTTTANLLGENPTVAKQNMQFQAVMEGKGFSEGSQQFSQLVGESTSTPAAAVTSQLGATLSTYSSGLTTPAEARVQLPVSITFGEKGWANMVAERSAMMASQSLKFADLRLDPPDLGPLQVKVSVNQDQASVSFVAANANVRDVLDQTVSRLKELLQEQGLDLVDVDVSDQESQQAQDESEQNTRGGSETANGEGELEQEQVHTVSTTAQYGVDHYA